MSTLTSATGCCSRRGRGAGFTLIELVVVLVILGVLSSLIAVSVSSDARRDTAHETERLKLVLELAEQEAQTSGRPVAWVAEAGGYRFLQADLERRWQPVTTDEYLRPRKLAEGLRIERILVNEQPLPAGAWLVFGSTAIPLFRVEVASPEGVIVLRARANGRVDVARGKPS